MKINNKFKLYEPPNKKKRFVGFVLDFSIVKSIAIFLVPLILFGTMFFALSDNDTKSVIMNMGVRSVMYCTNDFEINSVRKMMVYNGVSPLFGQKDTVVPGETIKKPKDKTTKKATKQHPAGYVEIKNETNYKVDTEAILQETFVTLSKKPKVLIVHTHASESYTSDENYTYNQTDNYRTDDCNYNMIRVGEVLAQTLSENGVEVIHDKTVNDNPSYNASYSKTKTVIEKHLSKNPNIEFVFDIHRDAVGDKESAARFIKNIDGKDCAQIMMVCGTDTNLENPDWRENLKLALHIQSRMEGMFPGLMRPVNLRKERFNMHLTTGSLIFEIGANGNTLTEALISAEYLGKGLAEFINSCIK